MVYQIPDAATLRGKRVTLQSPIDISYAAEIAELANDRSIRENIGAHGFPYPYTEEDASDFINRNRSTGTLPFAVDFLILHKGKPAGVIGLGAINFMDNNAHIGYWIGSKYRGLGLATEATGLACGYAFGTLRLHRLQTKVLDGNVPSMRVLQKNGFEVEGTERDSFFIDNEYKSFILFARIAEISYEAVRA